MTVSPPGGKNQLGEYDSSDWACDCHSSISKIFLKNIHLCTVYFFSTVRSSKGVEEHFPIAQLWSEEEGYIISIRKIPEIRGYSACGIRKICNLSSLILLSWDGAGPGFVLED